MPFLSIVTSTAPVRKVWIVWPPTAWYVALISGRLQRPSPLNTTQAGRVQAARPGELLCRLPWCGAKSTSQCTGCSANSLSSPGDSRSPDFFVKHRKKRGLSGLCYLKCYSFRMLPTYRPQYLPRPGKCSISGSFECPCVA